MKLSQAGGIAAVLWQEIIYHSSAVELGAFVVMSNHIHGIVIITREEIDNKNNVETGHALSPIDGNCVLMGDNGGGMMRTNRS